jgi:hypothetical protein
MRKYSMRIKKNRVESLEGHTSAVSFGIEIDA